MNIPAIGAARGVFELFVPGAFVILNAFAVLYSALDYRAQYQIRELAASPALSLVVLVCLGYLVGVILRLFRADIPDRWSARWNRFRNKDARLDRTVRQSFRTCWNLDPLRDEDIFEPWVFEDFPYVNWIRRTHGSSSNPEASRSVLEFHQKVWAPKRDSLEGKTFFNFCKTLINSEDERAASEIYSAEAQVRYLAGMFYALCIAMGLMLTGFAIRLALAPSDWSWLLFVVFFVAYAVMLLAIIRHYRVMRIKEVEIVFSATYRHRELFEQLKAQGPLPWRKRLSRALAILAGSSR